MAVNPQELLTKCLDNEAAFVDNIEKQIDAELTQKFNGTSVTLTFSDEQAAMLYRQRIIEELKKRYNLWNINYGSCDQREGGCWLTFAPRNGSKTPVNRR